MHVVGRGSCVCRNDSRANLPIIFIGVAEVKPTLRRFA
jgi:hypothetical protein